MHRLRLGARLGEEGAARQDRIARLPLAFNGPAGRCRARQKASAGEPRARLDGFARARRGARQYPLKLGNGGRAVGIRKRDGQPIAERHALWCAYERFPKEAHGLGVATRLQSGAGAHRRIRFDASRRWGHLRLAGRARQHEEPQQ